MLNDKRSSYNKIKRYYQYKYRPMFVLEYCAINQVLRIDFIILGEKKFLLYKSYLFVYYDFFLINIARSIQFNS